MSGKSKPVALFQSILLVVISLIIFIYLYRRRWKRYRDSLSQNRAAMLRLHENYVMASQMAMEDDIAQVNQRTPDAPREDAK